MAEPPLKDAGPGLIPPPTPSSLCTPSPLTPNGTRPRLGPRRQSRFTEDMTDRTPAASVSEQSMDYYWYGRSAEDVHTTVSNTDNSTHNSAVQDPDPAPQAEPTRQDRRSWVRFANAALHAVHCVVLSGFLASAMQVLREDMGSQRSIQAVIIIVFLSADILLDLVILFRTQKRWPTWGLASRFTLGVAYIVLFLVYVGLGSPFSDGHTYWSLSAGSAAPLVYTFLSVIGLWNLLHIPISRYQLGSRLLGTANSPPSFPPRPSPYTSSSTVNDTSTFNHQRFSVAETEHSSISLTWRRWVRTRSSGYSGSGYGSRDDYDPEAAGCFNGTVTEEREVSGDFTLREQPGEEDEVKDGDGSRATGARDEKGKEEEVKGAEGVDGVEEKGEEKDEKWREGRSEETVRPVEGSGDDPR